MSVHGFDSLTQKYVKFEKSNNSHSSKGLRRKPSFYLLQTSRRKSKKVKMFPNYVRHNPAKARPKTQAFRVRSPACLIYQRSEINLTNHVKL